MKVFGILALALSTVLGQPAPVEHPNRIEVVMLARQDLKAAGIDVDNDDCAGFRIVQLAAWRMRQDGAGLLQKSSGANCPLEGDSYAHDIIAYPDGTTIDAIGRGSEGPNTPMWGPNCCAADRYRAAIDPHFDSSPGPTPGPVPTPVPEPSPDVLGPIRDRLNSLDALTAILNMRIDALNSIIQRVSDAVDGIKPRVDQLEAKPVPASCRASAFGIPIHCELR